MNIAGEIVADNNSPNDKVEVIYNGKCENLQNVIQKAFNIYLKTGSYHSNKGVNNNV